MPVAIPIQPDHTARTIVKPTQEFSAGQHEPVASLIQPYSAFPKKITGPTLWTREELINDEGRWKFQWTPELIRELEEAYDAWTERQEDLPTIRRVCLFHPIVSGSTACTAS
jgi:hypothetical protein